MIVNTPISLGELIDKISILRIKKNNIMDQKKLKHIDQELTLLDRVLPDSVSDKKITVIEPENIYDRHYDIISPCALGGTINHNSLKDINCNIIAGAANNQLENDNEIPDIFINKNILYIPDFLINAGGIIILMLLISHFFQ